MYLVAVHVAVAVHQRNPRRHMQQYVSCIMSNAHCLHQQPVATLYKPTHVLSMLHWNVRNAPERWSQNMQGLFLHVKAVGLDPASNPSCAALHAVLDAIESMRLFMDAFLHAGTVDLPDWSVADIMSMIAPSQTLASCHADKPSATVALPTGSAKLRAPCHKVQKGDVIEVYRVGSAWQTSKEGLLPVSNPGCPPPDSQLHPASAPASTPPQAAAEKGKAQREAKKQKAKQGVTPPAVAQQASPQPRPPAADDLRIAAKHKHPALSGDADSPFSEAL